MKERDRGEREEKEIVFLKLNDIIISNINGQSWLEIMHKLMKTF